MLEIVHSPAVRHHAPHVSFRIGLWINKKVATPLANPLNHCNAHLVGVLTRFGIPSML